MSARRFIGVIDIGKTNAKYAVVDSADWQEAAVRTMENCVLSGPSYPHFDVEGIWSFLLSSMKELQADYPVSALSITTHGASAVLLDGDGELALPVLDYEHDGPDTMAADYDAARPSFGDTGSPRLPVGLNLGAQIFWQMHAFPDDAKRVAHIVAYPQFWAYRLTGVMANEVTSLGCHTDLWNPWTASFSTLVEEQGWAALMAPMRKAGDVLDTLMPNIAQKAGLPQGIPVMCGIHDSNASLYPHLTTRAAPFSVVSTGTWVICMAVGGQDIEPDPTRDILVNVNAFGDPVPSARFMGGREFETLMEGRTKACTDADLAAVLKKVTMLLPSVENRSGPFQGREAEWLGGEPTPDGECFAAVSLYLALMTSVCLELAGADGASVVEGPFAKNETFLSMLEIATGRSVIASGSSATGTSIGAAMLAVEQEPELRTPADGLARRASPEMYAELAGYAKLWRSMVLCD